MASANRCEHSEDTKRSHYLESLEWLVAILMYKMYCLVLGTSVFVEKVFATQPYFWPEDANRAD